MRYLIRLDPRTGVFHLELCAAVRPVKPQHHPSFPRCVLDGIIEQVAHHLVQSLPIAEHHNPRLYLLRQLVCILLNTR